MEIKHFTLEEWKPISKDVHLTCFGEIREPDENTFDFALMVTKDDVPQCYCTCIELDKYSCYMQHGGTFPSARGTTATARGYHLLIKWIHDKYPRITTKTKVTNSSMLKLALSAGFKINGFDNFGEDTFLRMVNDKELI